MDRLDAAAVEKLREELAAARSCLPSAETVEKLLNRAHVPDDLDTVEEGMEFQDAIEGVRAALDRMAESLGAPTVTVHMLVAGLPLCGFSTAQPRDWPENHKWCHTIAEFLTNVRAPEKCCARCLKAFEMTQAKPLRRCATCKKPFPDEYIGHNVTDREWYCTPECYRAAGGHWP